MRILIVFFKETETRRSVFSDLFICGCAGSSLLRGGSLWLQRVEAGAWLCTACSRGGSSRVAPALGTGLRQRPCPSAQLSAARGSDPRSLNWPADSQPLGHRGSRMLLLRVDPKGSRGPWWSVRSPGTGCWSLGDLHYWLLPCLLGSLRSGPWSLGSGSFLG